MLKVLFNPAVVFTLGGMVLMLLAELQRLRNPFFVLLGPPLFSCGIGFFIPQFVWEDSAFLVAVTFILMGVNYLLKRFTSRSLFTRLRHLVHLD